VGILKDIQEIGAVTRRVDNVERRVLKTTEEVGELAEAVLSATSASNAKGKSWMDIIDEACDVAIMGIDIAMTRPPGYETIDDEAWREIVKKIFALKLKKWQTQVKSGRTLIPKGPIEMPVAYLDGEPVYESNEGCGQTMGHGVVCGQGMLCINCAPELHKTSG
jgi:NTP pyrophosphatase (non-canonical NTP hydrolase)